MKNIFKFVLVLGAFAALLSIPLFTGETVQAQAIDAACSANPGSAICSGGSGASVESVVQIVVNILLFIVGIISVVMIIIGGVRYATSAGNASSVTAAKNTILYAVVGLVVAIAAYAIVEWIVNQL